MASFEDELRAAAAAAPLDEALAGLKRIAEAAGIFEQTWAAQSIGEVCEMIARWCEIRRGTRNPELGFTPEHEAEARRSDHGGPVIR